MNKIHAKDYLVEFADQQDSWLKCLIYEAILTNGNISEDRLNEIYIAFKSSNEIVSPHIQQFSPKQNSNIELLELTHTSGVSALGQNQTIKFSPNTTFKWKWKK